MASKGNRQTKGMPGSPLDSIEKARGAAMIPEEKIEKKKWINGIIPGIIKP